MSSSQQNTPSSSPSDPHIANTTCSCGQPIAQRVSQTKHNPNRKFYTCATGGCKFWTWADQFRLSAPGFKAAGSDSPLSSPRKDMSSATKRKRSVSPQGAVPPRASTSKRGTDWWARKADYDEPDSEEWPDSEVEKMMDMSHNKLAQLSPARREVPPTSSPSKTPGSMIKEDPDNPFVVTSTPKRAGAAATPILDNVHKTPGGSIVPKSKVSEVFDEMLDVQLRLRMAIETADRKSLADSRGVEYKIKRIKMLEAEVEDLRKQNEALKRENEELRQRYY